MLVVKDNALVNASYNLELVEQRLILLAIIEARESGKGINANDPLIVRAESYINEFGVHRTTAYQALKDASKDLFARQFSYHITSPSGTVTNKLSRWVSEIGYTDSEASVSLIFAPAIVPLITRLEQQFTSYDLEQVSNLGSKYSTRLYELLIAWRETGKTPMYDLTDLRGKLGLTTEYALLANFKLRVLDLALDQINKHTDITVNYEQHKKGRQVIGFSFKFKTKQKATPRIERDPKTIDMFCNLTDAQVSKYASVLSRVSQISDLSTFKSYDDFALWIANILRDPKSVREETAKRVFKALRMHTDFKG